MNDFTAGAMRRATESLRAKGMSSANDLVQRTLAQHGLSGGPAQKTGGSASSLPGLDSLMAQFGRGNAEVDIPQDAEFRVDVFSGSTGSRQYRTYVPSTLGENPPEGIILMLHGCTQTAEDFAIGTGMNDLAEAHRLIVIYPQQSRGSNAQSCWNWFSKGDQKRYRGEPAILAGITREAVVKFRVDEKRVFVAGLSAGAAMAVILGITYPDVFAAVGAHSGLPYGVASDVSSAFSAMAGNAANAQPLPSHGPGVRTIVFHGGADSTVHPGNGDKIMRNAMDEGPRETLETEEQGTIGGKSFTRRVISTLDGSPAFEQWRVDRLGHAWSGGDSGGSYTDPEGPNASSEMVRFFLAVDGSQV
ncbi:MAG: extracellular catalytic domain type 1 short-chain-length polyhydroxyalkanoate depolymerase [Heliomarina sp.]|uniref:extracellular catalytic domain type 1 short-chain-length polyhydroxyalkanoate depolymerase n=1 Tax=Heliomarina sp. TaxID=2917556 RepID=UPI0040590E38